MKKNHTAHPRAIALLMAAVALPAMPAFAQEAAAPPPVASTVPAPAAVPVPAPAPATQAPVFAPRQEVVQPVPVRPAPVATEEAAPAPRARTEPVRRVVRPAVQRKPVAATSAATTPAATPAAAAPAPAVPEVMPVPAQVPAALPKVTATDTAATTETTTSSVPWLWIGLGILAIAALAALFGRGRNRRPEEIYYEEPVINAPVTDAPAVAPVVAAPVAQPVVTPTTMVLQTVEPALADDERPWIGLSIWPKQVDDDGNIQYDLVVENAGDVEAHDVRVSSFLIDGTNPSPMESSLIGGSDTRSVDVRAGASVQIAQTMEMTEGASPRIVAEARYPLPGGGEGHIAARFAIDTAKDGSVEARLDDLLERV